MTLNSGKFITDLGDRDGCNANPQLVYALLKAIDSVIKVPILTVGFCAPSECTNKEYYTGITDFVNNIILA